MSGFELFCERCGQRYGGQEEATRRPLGQRLLSAVGFGAPAPVAREEPLLRFCLACRGYTCPSCWNDDAGFCQTCVPLPEPVFVPEHVHLPELPPTPEPVYVPDPALVPQPLFAAAQALADEPSEEPLAHIAEPDTHVAEPEPEADPIRVAASEYPWDFAVEYVESEEPYAADEPAAQDPVWAILDEVDVSAPEPVVEVAPAPVGVAEPGEPEVLLPAALAATPEPEPVAGTVPEPQLEPVAAESWTEAQETPAVVEEVPPPPPIFVPLPPLGPIIAPPRPTPPSQPTIAFEMPDQPPAFLMARSPEPAAVRPQLPARLFDGPRPGVRGCPNCDLPVSAAARFCRRCGSAQA